MGLIPFPRETAYFDLPFCLYPMGLVPVDSLDPLPERSFTLLDPKMPHNLNWQSLISSNYTADPLPYKYAYYEQEQNSEERLKAE